MLVFAGHIFVVDERLLESRVKGRIGSLRDTTGTEVGERTLVHRRM
jgi:hypothetical protein